MPEGLTSLIALNHESAERSIRTIMRAQLVFRQLAILDADGDGEGDYFPDVGWLSMEEDFPMSHLVPQDSDLADGVKDGYVFEVIAVGGAGFAGIPPTFAVTAQPEQPGITGRHFYYADQTGVIRYEVGQAATAESPPLNKPDDDEDGIINVVEAVVYGTDPFSVDSDGDGYSDAVEIAYDSDPLDPVSGEAAVVALLRRIHQAELAYLAGGYSDMDANGVGDFGHFEQLAYAGLFGPFFGVRYGYAFMLVVTPGSADAPSTYECTAMPLTMTQLSIKGFFIDQSGVLRFSSDGSVPSADSPIYPYIEKAIAHSQEETPGAPTE